MSSDNTKPKFLTANFVKTVNEATDVAEVQQSRPVLQILTVKDVTNKKNMKDKLTVSDGTHKILCIVKDKINTNASNAYSQMNVIRLNKFMIKEVGKVKVIIPNEDFEIITKDVEDIIGKPKNYEKDSAEEEMEQEFEIPYAKVEATPEPKEETKEEPIEDSEPEDVEMNETPVKTEDNKEDMVDVTPSPAKVDSNIEDDIYTPIKALSPMNSDWIIKARVSKKYPVKEWANQRGQGKLLNFELVDKYGTQIQATLFNKAVDKFDSILEQDKVYIF